MVTGIAAAVLALSACGIAAGTGGGTPGTHAAAPQAGHAEIDTRVADMRELAQVKRETSWKAAELAWARQPQLDNRFTEMRELAKTKRETSWKAAELAWSR